MTGGEAKPESERAARRRPLAFFSYSRSDSERALTIASLVRKAGFTVWIDSSALHAGDEFARSIAKAIEGADVFFVCLSPSSVESPWVTRELSSALSLFDRRGRPQPIPIKIAPVSVPEALARFHYVDAAESLTPLEQELTRLRGRFRQQVTKTFKDQAFFVKSESLYRRPRSAPSSTSRPEKSLSLAAVSIGSSLTTQKYYGGAGNGITEPEVRTEQIGQQRMLEAKIRGILANFVIDGAITETGSVVLVNDGEIKTQVDSVVGDLPGSLRLKTTTTAVLVSPDKRRVVRTLPDRIRGLGADDVEYTFRLKPLCTDIGNRVVTYFRQVGTVVRLEDHRVVGDTPQGLRVTITWSSESLGISASTQFFPALDPTNLAETLTGYNYV